jgi:hypothetical protein
MIGFCVDPPCCWLLPPDWPGCCDGVFDPPCCCEAVVDGVLAMGLPFVMASCFIQIAPLSGAFKAR